MIRLLLFLIYKFWKFIVFLVSLLSRFCPTMGQIVDCFSSSNNKRDLRHQINDLKGIIQLKARPLEQSEFLRRYKEIENALKNANLYGSDLKMLTEELEETRVKYERVFHVNLNDTVTVEPSTSSLNRESATSTRNLRKRDDRNDCDGNYNRKKTSRGSVKDSHSVDVEKLASNRSKKNLQCQKYDDVQNYGENAEISKSELANFTSTLKDYDKRRNQTSDLITFEGEIKHTVVREKEKLPVRKIDYFSKKINNYNYGTVQSYNASLDSNKKNLRESDDFQDMKLKQSNYNFSSNKASHSTKENCRRHEQNNFSGTSSQNHSKFVDDYGDYKHSKTANHTEKTARKNEFGVTKPNAAQRINNSSRGQNERVRENKSVVSLTEESFIPRTQIITTNCSKNYGQMCKRDQYIKPTGTNLLPSKIQAADLIRESGTLNDQNQTKDIFASKDQDIRSSDYKALRSRSSSYTPYSGQDSNSSKCLDNFNVNEIGSSSKESYGDYKETELFETSMSQRNFSQSYNNQENNLKELDQKLLQPGTLHQEATKFVDGWNFYEPSETSNAYNVSLYTAQDNSSLNRTDLISTLHTNKYQSQSFQNSNLTPRFDSTFTEKTYSSFDDPSGAYLSLPNSVEMLSNLDQNENSWLPIKTVAEKPSEEILDVHQFFQDDLDWKALASMTDEEKINLINKHATTLEAKVEEFQEEEYSLEYFVLDEKLMRLIENLDKIKCHESQELKEQKIQVIKYINNLHGILDKRAKNNTN